MISVTNILYVAAAGFLFLSLALFVGVRGGRHFGKIRKAKRIYEKLQDMENHYVIPYLRKIDPYVFEELVLWAFKQKGYPIYRNRRYSGDGGFDGMVKIDGRKVLVQDKRYSNHICLSHVKDFEELCRKRHKKGIFVHTGKTGSGSWKLADNSERITIVSGRRLVELMRKTKEETGYRCPPAAYDKGKPPEGGR